MNATTTQALSAVTGFFGTYMGQAIGFVLGLMAFAFAFVLIGRGIRWAWARVKRIGIR